MVHLNEEIRFILNDKETSATVPAGMLVLDYVRQLEHLTGTKQGCKEGDCGACTVILGELDQEGVRYQPMTSCLMPMGELEGKHLVTIEGLNMSELSPIQSAMVNRGGTQCGYCTPGFIVSMTAGLMEPKLPLNEEGVLYAISGNLCRCTGYHSICSAGVEAARKLAGALVDRERISALVEAGALPLYFVEIPERLRALRAQLQQRGNGADTPMPDWSVVASRLILAGGTDLYVQRGADIPDEPVALINNGERPAPARLEGNQVRVDARMTFEAFADDPLIKKLIPEIGAYNLLIASWPMRTRSSLGGNICNASPIADMTCLLLALEAGLTLLSPDGRRRELPLKEFYLGYKKLNKTQEEVVEAVTFPSFARNTYTNWEKVSKRAWLDIATVNSACKVVVEDGTIIEAHLTLGGVAATPLYLCRASALLAGRPLSEDTALGAADIAMEEFSPIDDVRGSARYKRLLARQLLLVHFTKLFPETVKEEAVYAAP